jgi:hypothetical protein
VKSPATAPAADSLRRAIALHAAVQHPAIIRLRSAIDAEGRAGRRGRLGGAS